MGNFYINVLAHLTSMYLALVPIWEMRRDLERFSNVNLCIDEWANSRLSGGLKLNIFRHKWLKIEIAKRLTFGRFKLKWFTNWVKLDSQIYLLFFIIYIENARVQNILFSQIQNHLNRHHCHDIDHLFFRYLKLVLNKAYSKSAHSRKKRIIRNTFQICINCFFYKVIGLLLKSIGVEFHN